MALQHHKRATRPPASSERDAPFALNSPGGDGWTLDGYGAVFNRQTTIDSWEGRFREQIAPGSMKRSFAQTPPKVQFDHGRHPLIGSWPIAKLERIAEETDPVLAPEGGAHIVARMIPHLFFEPIREAINVGAINGMSFRFEVMREQWHTAGGEPITDERELAQLLEQSWRDELPDAELPVRTLKELKVPEMGPVTWPAYEDTSVGMRTVIDLGQLQKDRGQRTLLAKAMWSMAEQENTDDAQQSTDRSGSVGEPPSEDAQPTTTTVVGEHPSKSDAQPSTTETVVAERQSQSSNKPPRGSRAIDLTLRNMRDTLLRIRSDDERTAGGTAQRAHPHPPPIRQTARGNPYPHGGTGRTGRPRRRGGSGIPGTGR